MPFSVLVFCKIPFQRSRFLSDPQNIFTTLGQYLLYNLRIVSLAQLWDFSKICKGTVLQSHNSHVTWTSD